ncbi:MAG: hypothetical protein KDC34_09960 [Saprospiraceae bacterium]|nr:hypothetical protein [Saprospiraceae bacterium]
MSIRQIILFCFFLLSLPMTLVAQPDDLPAEQVTVLKNFEATLAESERLTVQPELPELDTSKAQQAYTLPNKFLQVDYPAPKIRPLAMSGDDVPQAYNGYAKLGAGIPTSIYGSAGYHIFAEDQFDFGIDLKHHSANFKKIEHQRFMVNDIQGQGTYYFDEGFAANAKLGYNTDDVYYYAFNSQEELMDSVVQKADVQQRFSTFNFGASFFNGERNVGDIDYKAGFDLYTLGDNYGSNERGFNLELGGTKWINGDHALTVLISTDFTRFEDTAVQNLNNFYLQPSFTFHGDFFKAKAGINLVSYKDEFTFFPDLEVSVNVIGSQLAAFAGWNGSLVKNNLQTLSNFNPFINTRIPLANTEYQHYFGGIKGDIKIVQYSATVGVKQAKGLALYIPEVMPESVIRRRFDIFYDTATIVNFEASLAVNPTKGLTILGTLNNNVYSLTNAEKPYGLPAFTLNGGVIYTTLENKLKLRADLFMENGIPYITDEGLTDNLNGLFDISFGADYFLTQNFGLFLQVNNLADNKRQRWAGYPTYGINVLGGINLKF